MLKKFFNQNFISVLYSTAAIFILGGWIWASFALRTAGDVPLILHFDDVNGITSVGGLSTVVFMGVLGLLVVGMNFAIARELDFRSQRFFSRFLAAITLLFAILLFVAFVAIINVNV